MANLWLSSSKHDRLARQVPPCRTSPFAAPLRESKTTFSYARVVLWAYLARTGLFCRPFVLVPSEKLQVCSVVFRERLCVV